MSDLPARRCSPQRPVAGLLLLAGLAGLAAGTAGCAAGGAALRPAAGDVQPWQIPPEAFGSQRLYRVSYSGPDAEGSFRLTLRLAAPDRYQVRSADPVGRALWSLDVAAEEGLWLDHRNRAFCTFEGRFDISGVPLAPFPLLSLPSLLLGRLPAEPAAGAAVEQKGKQISYRDARERRWTATVERGAVQSWTLWTGPAPAVWWFHRDGWAILSDREQGVQVRWKEVLSEPLAAPPEPLAAPAGYRREDCARPAN